ncbi:MAG: copper chaperone PCu(A)C [Cellvibrionales bacterium]|jgi:copper(I)-binding protein|nr:copper chaperone PCu(A)C [Cellvibrionales bacterium]
MLSRVTSIFKALTLCATVLLSIAPLQAAEKIESALTINDAYFRLMPPGRSMTAAYMTLTNNSGETQVLTSLRSDSAGSVELHQHTHIDGMMKMRKVDQLSIAAGESVELVPGGYHLMLFGVQDGLGLDDTMVIELQLESGKSVIVNAKARSFK